MKYKLIRSAAHNFGASFVSALNWAGDDHTMSYLARGAVSTGSAEFTIDLLTGQAAPKSLLTPPVGEAVALGVRQFRELFARERVDIKHLVAARMLIRFKVKGTIAEQGVPPPWTLPFQCVVTVVDDREKEHEGCVVGMWHVSTSYPVVGYRY